MQKVDVKRRYKRESTHCPVKFKKSVKIDNIIKQIGNSVICRCTPGAHLGHTWGTISGTPGAHLGHTSGTPRAQPPGAHLGHTSGTSRAQAPEARSFGQYEL